MHRTFPCLTRQTIKQVIGGALLFFALCLDMAAQEANTPNDTTGAQVTPAVAGEITLTSAAVEAKRADYAAQIATAENNLDAVNENTPREIADAHKKIIQLLERVDGILVQQLSVLKQIDSDKASVTQFKDQLNQLRSNGPSEKPPYSYLLLDNLRGQLTAELEKAPSLENTMKTLLETLEQARGIVQAKNTTRIAAKEALDNNTDETATPLLTLRHRTAQIDSQFAEEIVVLNRLKIENQKLSKAVYDAQIALLQERIKWIEKDTIFSEADLQEQLQRMDTAEVELATRLKKAEDNLRLAQKKYENAQDNLAKSSDPTNTLREEERARRYERDYYQEEVSILPRRITRTKDRRLIWQRRYEVVNGKASIEQMQNWVTECNSRINGLDIDKGYCTSILTEIRKDLGAVTEKFEQLKDEKAVTDKLIAQQKYLQDRISLLEDNIARIESLKRFYHTLLDEIKKQTQTLSWEEMVQYVMVKINDILSYSVWSSSQKPDEAQEYNLTVSNIAAAVAYLIFGIYIARLVSRHGIRFVMRRLGAHEGASAAIQSLSYYFFLILVIVLTFDAINIPLTAFAFLGGALAIGIGFGSQNILNNFISGLILLIERPIRVGDMIEVDGTDGTVANIGPRCTRLTTFSNVDHLIPNSKLLENKVVNLTLDDTVIRTLVKVGVAYGTDLRKAFQLIRKAVDDHGLINRHPEPIVTLADFGNDALIFEVRFWITMSRVNRLIVESDVRHRIYNLFEEAGIVIAYPQRDVHLDTHRPLEIRLLPNETPERPPSS